MVVFSNLNEMCGSNLEIRMPWIRGYYDNLPKKVDNSNIVATKGALKRTVKILGNPLALARNRGIQGIPFIRQRFC